MFNLIYHLGNSQNFFTLCLYLLVIFFYFYYANFTCVLSRVYMDCVVVNVIIVACSLCVFLSMFVFCVGEVFVECVGEVTVFSKRHSIQAVELPQRTQAAVQIVSNLPVPSNGDPIYRFLGMRTRWMAGAAAHKSG